LHHFPGVNSLADVVSKMFRHLFAATKISITSIGQKAAQKRQCEAVPSELVAGGSQLDLVPFNTQRSEQLRTGITGQLLQLATQS
jgi:hypothetical protein